MVPRCQMISHKGILTIAPQIGIGRCSTACHHQGTSVVSAIAADRVDHHRCAAYRCRLFNFYDRHHLASACISHLNGDQTCGQSGSYRGGIGTGNVVLHKSVAPYKVIGRFSAVDHQGCPAIISAITGNVLPTGEYCRQSVGIVQYHCSGFLTPVGIGGGNQVRPGGKSGCRSTGLAIAPEIGIRRYSAACLCRGRTVDISFTTRVGRSRDDHLNRGLRLENVDPIGSHHAAIGIFHHHLIASEGQTGGRFVGRTVAPLIGVGFGTACDGHRCLTIVATEATYMAVGRHRGFRCQQCRLSDDHIDDLFTTVGIGHQDGVIAGCQSALPCFIVCTTPVEPVVGIGSRTTGRSHGGGAVTFSVAAHRLVVCFFYHQLVGLGDFYVLQHRHAAVTVVNYHLVQPCRDVHDIFSGRCKAVAAVPIINIGTRTRAARYSDRDRPVTATIAAHIPMHIHNGGQSAQIPDHHTVDYFASVGIPDRYLVSTCHQACDR